MRIRYRAGFTLGRDVEKPPDPKEVAQLIARWATQNDRVDTLLADPALGDPTQEVARTSTASGASVETSVTEADGRRLWGLRFQHPQESDPALIWTTDVVLSAEAKEVRIGCLTSVGDRTGALVPFTARPSRPRIISFLLEKFGGRAGLAVSTAPSLLKTSSAMQFVSALFDDSRRLPTVFVSCRIVDDRPSVDAKRLADWLAGLAHVVVAQDRFPSFKIGDLLPPSLACKDGAVRVYWPRLKLQDPPFHHPLFNYPEVRDIDRVKNGFAERLLGIVSEIAVYTFDPTFPSWEMIESAKRRQLRDDTRRLHGADETLKLFESDYDDLGRRAKALEEALEEARRESVAAKQEAADARREAADWRLGYSAAMEERSRFVAASGPPPKSVQDAVDRAAKQHGERLVIQLNSRSEVKKNPYLKPEEVLSALDFLGTVYFNSAIGKARCPDLDFALRERCGWSYQSSSENTMKAHEDWYSIKRIGRPTIWLREHIGRGTSKDPRETIRIAFKWIEEDQRVLIGYIGQHQETDAT